MKGYVLADAAELDLNAIWEYIAEDNIDAADRWIAKLFAAFEELARTPGMGHTRQDLTSRLARLESSGLRIQLCCRYTTRRLLDRRTLQREN